MTHPLFSSLLLIRKVEDRYRTFSFPDCCTSTNIFRMCTMQLDRQWTYKIDLTVKQLRTI
ncbi:hypothetical protein HMPREF2533_03303 [Bacteroides fragilis]|nr:hypothetical protein HMPREF2530_03303 [Bacteroides fragilis]KXU43277.1 hypothetical protein HMPREF2533_03303 [Bacteroides fragilis]